MLAAVAAAAAAASALFALSAARSAPARASASWVSYEVARVLAALRRALALVATSLSCTEACVCASRSSDCTACRSRVSSSRSEVQLSASREAVSFARRSPQECIWRHACEGYPNEAQLDGNARFRTAQVRSADDGELAQPTHAGAAASLAGVVAAAPAADDEAAPAADDETTASLSDRRLIFVTASYPHAAQVSKLARCAAAIRGALAVTDRILWILAEDAAHLFGHAAMPVGDHERQVDRARRAQELVAKV